MGSHTMPWVAGGWTAMDVSYWVDQLDYYTADRNALRPCVNPKFLFIEYLLEEIAHKHWDTILEHLRNLNKFLVKNDLPKFNFSEGYEHFGTEKFKKTQVRYLLKAYGPYALVLVIFMLWILCRCCKCICGSKKKTEDEKE